MEIHDGDYVLVKRLEELDDYHELSYDTKQLLSLYCGKVFRVLESSNYGSLTLNWGQEVVITINDIVGKVVGNRIVKE